jgi:hypothetical protein
MTGQLVTFVTESTEDSSRDFFKSTLVLEHFLPCPARLKFLEITNTKYSKETVVKVLQMVMDAADVAGQHFNDEPKTKNKEICCYNVCKKLENGTQAQIPSAKDHKIHLNSLKIYSKLLKFC